MAISLASSSLPPCHPPLAAPQIDVNYVAQKKRLPHTGREGALLTAVALWLVLAAAAITTEAPKAQPAGTRRMAERLAQMIQDAGPFLVSSFAKAI